MMKGRLVKYLKRYFFIDEDEYPELEGKRIMKRVYLR